eukprot:scaffold109881_cov55-Cyclotella_meneghiniana.AAC.3
MAFINIKKVLHKGSTSCSCGATMALQSSTHARMKLSVPLLSSPLSQFEFESPRLSGARILRIEPHEPSRDLAEPRTNHDGTSVEALAASTEAASQ